MNEIGAQVLIIDDDPVVRHLLSSVIRAADHTVHTAATGKEGLDWLANCYAFQNCPALILLDVQLGDMPGELVLKKIRELSKNQPVTVVMLSANTEKEVRAAHADLEADFFLEKPFPPGRIIEILEKMTTCEL